MKGLLIKDFSLLLQQKKLLAMILFLAVLLNFNVDQDETFVIGYLSFVCVFLIINSITQDEYENGYSFLFTLPVGRNSYVRSKYLYSFLLCLVSWLSGILIAVMVFLVKNQASMIPGAMKGVGLVLAGALAFLAVMIPIQFQFGAEKGRIMMAIFLCIAYLIGFLIAGMAQTAPSQLEPFLEMVVHLEQLWKQNPGSIEGILWAGTVLLTGISYGISIMIMKRKEF